MKKDSTVVSLIKLVYEHACETKTFSWRMLNLALSNALMIAVNSGMRFERGDFSEIAKRFNSGFWIGDGEAIYWDAIDVGNISAAISLEGYKGRYPFIFDKILNPDTKNSFIKRRIHVADMILWKTQIASVTSFNDEKGYLTACTYKNDTDGGYRTNIIKNRFRINHADIIARRGNG